MKFLLIFTVFLALAVDCFAKEFLRTPKPVHLSSRPARVKPVFEKATFDKGSRIRATKDKAVIEKPVFDKKQIETPKFDKDKKDQPEWAKSVIETKWKQDAEPVFSQSPTEKKADSKVKRGWFRKLRDP